MKNTAMLEYYPTSLWTIKEEQTRQCKEPSWTPLSFRKHKTVMKRDENSLLPALLEVLKLAEKVCDHHEAHKLTDEGYVELQLLNACKRARSIKEERHLFEVVKVSDVNRGFVGDHAAASGTPCSNAEYNAHEKRWEVSLQTLEELLSIAYENESFIRLCFPLPNEADLPMIEVEDEEAACITVAEKQ